MEQTQNYLWSSYQYRLNLLNTGTKLPIHWLFLPGGPGLGSEYYHEFAQKLKLPGITWLVDFPGDASNRFEQMISKENWIDGLINLTQTLQPCILVTHSFSGMFALSIPKLEKFLTAFIIMNSSPNHTWFSQRQEKLHQVNSDIDAVRNEYLANMNDVTFKNLTLASSSLFFTEDERLKGERLLLNLPYNVTYYDRIQQSFHPQFTYKWVPQQIPTMIIGSENDILCPPSIFLEEKDFNRQNIQIHTIAKAGHFPWLNSFEEVKQLFDEFIENKLTSLVKAK